MWIEAEIQKETYKRFLQRRKKKWQLVLPLQGEIHCKCASIALLKVLACPEFFGCINFFLT